MQPNGAVNGSVSKRVGGSYSRHVFNLIARSTCYRTFATGFREATGLSLTLLAVPARIACGPTAGNGDPEFCRLLRHSHTGRVECQQFRQQVVELAGRRRCPCSARCFAGLQETAIPIFSGGVHVATLLAGKTKSRRRPADWEKIMQVAGEGGPAQLVEFKRAFRAVPALEGRQVEGARSLLEFLGKVLEEHLSAWLLFDEHAAPLAVVRAKDYIRKHATQPITLPNVARNSGISTYHLCKLFSKTTGMTFTDFVAQARVEGAKLLLQQTSLRMAEIAFASGFGSVPTFNRVFKRWTRQTATVYRSSVMSCAGQPTGPG
jgi:AraC-like DNA-binding protein/ligand-binding sensor protein